MTRVSCPTSDALVRSTCRQILAQMSSSSCQTVRRLRIDCATPQLRVHKHVGSPHRAGHVYLWFKYDHEPMGRIRHQPFAIRIDSPIYGPCDRIAASANIIQCNVHIPISKRASCDRRDLASAGKNVLQTRTHHLVPEPGAHCCMKSTHAEPHRKLMLALSSDHSEQRNSLAQSHNVLGDNACT